MGKPVCFKNDRRNAVAYSNAHFGRGVGPINLDDLECTGSEIDLLRCKHPTLGVHDCTHYEDAGVQCGKRFSKLSINLRRDFQLKIVSNHCWIDI